MFRLIMRTFVFLLVTSHAVHGWTTGTTQLVVTPLVGGPKWLPLHVKVVVDKRHAWDFLPLNPTDVKTTMNLVSFKSVPGEIRYYKTDANGQEEVMETEKEKTLVISAHEFVESYPSRDLHLLTNNCWTFAFALLWHLHTTNE